MFPIVLGKPKIDEILINLLVEQISVVSRLNKYFQNQEIIRPPKYFLISLNRAGIYNKIYKRVFLDKLFQCKIKRYTLKAIIAHTGKISGHFMIYIKRDENWIYCNDEKTNIVSNKRRKHY